MRGPSNDLKSRIRRSSTGSHPLPDAPVEAAAQGSVLQAHYGHAVVRAALQGANLDGLGATLRDAMMGEIAGVSLPVPGSTSNSTMLRVMRQAQGHGAGDFSVPGGSGQPLPEVVRARMEAAFGHNFEHVRIHTDAASAQAADELHAHAFAIGKDVYFGGGEFAPGTPQGDRLLAHELTHVVQYDEGRLGSVKGVSQPTDPSEQEAYATEAHIMARLPAIDAQLGDPQAETGPDTSRYSGGPPTLRDSAGEDDGTEAATTGPTVSEEDALLGPLPSAEEGQASAELPQAAPEGQAESAAAFPDAGAPAEPLQERSDGSIDSISVPPLEVEGGREGAIAPATPPAFAVPPVARLADWATQARQEGTTRSAAITAAATEASSAVRAAAAATVGRLVARFAEARSQLDAAAAETRAAVAAARSAADASVDAGVDAALARADAGFDERSERVRRATDEARAAIEATVEAEAARALEGSAERAAQAQALAEQTGSGGEAPLAEAQADLARRTAEEVAKVCIQTGEDAVTEVRKAGESRTGGLEDQAQQVGETLATAREQSHHALEAMREEARASLALEASHAESEIDACVGEALAALDERESQLTEWFTSESDTACVEIASKGTEYAASVLDGFEHLALAYDDAVTTIESAFAEAAGEQPAPEDVQEAHDACQAELAAIWAEHGTRLQQDSEQIVSALTDQATAITEGFAETAAEVESSLDEIATNASAALTRIGENFASFAEQCAERVRETIDSQVDATLTEADRACEEHASALEQTVSETETALASAVDEQLAWEDAQIEQASVKIADGQGELASEYVSLKAQAEAQKDDASPAVQRGWLGDLWDWFADLGDSILEWFEEKLGGTLGSILGGILRAIVYVLGTSACAMVWYYAQIINIIWGFIWGETAIPGYGGGVYAFIGDLIAGVLVVGDIRDIIKYWFIYPRMGRGDGWLLFWLGAIAVIGLVPWIGDIGKAIVKQFLKGALKRLTKELGEELAERLVREIGEEAAEALLDKLGKETLERLGRDLSGDAIQQLVDTLGEQTVKQLAGELSGSAIQALATRLTAPALRELTSQVGVRGVKELHETFGSEGLKTLLDELGQQGLKQCYEAFGAMGLKNLVAEFTERGLKDLLVDFTPALIKEAVDELTAKGLKELIEGITRAHAKKLITELGVSTVGRLHREMVRAPLHQTSLIATVKKLGGVDTLIAIVKADGVEAVIQYGAEAIHKYTRATLDQAARQTATSIATSQLQKKWKHAADFGITSAWKAKDTAAQDAFRHALDDVVSNADKVFAGPYHTFDPAFHYFKGELLVITDAAGNFISGWKGALNKLNGITQNAPPLGNNNFRVR